MATHIVFLEQQLKTSEVVRLAEVAALTKRLDDERLKVSVLNAKLSASEHECKTAKKEAEEAAAAAAAAAAAKTPAPEESQEAPSTMVELRKYKGWATERGNQILALQAELRKMKAACADVSKQYMAKNRELSSLQSKFTVINNSLMHSKYMEKQYKSLLGANGGQAAKSEVESQSASR